jgi:UPF0755 protein
MVYNIEISQKFQKMILLWDFIAHYFSRLKKLLFSFEGIIFLTFSISLALGIFLYFREDSELVIASSINEDSPKHGAIHIRSNSTWTHVIDSLYKGRWISNKKTFEDRLASKKMSTKAVTPGKYFVSSHMNIDTLITNIANGQNMALNRFTFNPSAPFWEVLKRADEALETSSLHIKFWMNNPQFLKLHGFTNENIKTIFIPNTYYLKWAMSPQDFLKRMLHESRLFWNENRVNKAAIIGLDTKEVYILASIIEKETLQQSEKSRMAGVYLKRIKTPGWKLEANPTLVYAVGDPNLTKLKPEHYELNTPYNTYKFKGLPPGPICVPSTQTIDAVLNAEKNDFWFFCAKPDLSGLHVFVKTLKEHKTNVNKYYVIKSLSQ